MQACDLASSKRTRCEIDGGSGGSPFLGMGKRGDSRCSGTMAIITVIYRGEGWIEPSLCYSRLRSVCDASVAHKVYASYLGRRNPVMLTTPSYVTRSYRRSVIAH